MLVLRNCWGIEMKNIKLNPNAEHVAKIQKAIKENDGFCPCAIHKTEDTKCMCLEFRTTGTCHCGLYVSEGSN